MNSVNEVKMTSLANSLGGAFDYAYGEDPVVDFSSQTITVYVNRMTKKQYNAMYKDIVDYKVSGKGYTIRAITDYSEYEYWRDEGKNGEANYIIVTAYIENVNIINPSELKAAAETAIAHFGKYDNLEEEYSKPRKNSRL